MLNEVSNHDLIHRTPNASQKEAKNVVGRWLNDAFWPNLLNITTGTITDTLCDMSILITFKERETHSHIDTCYMCVCTYVHIPTYAQKSWQTNKKVTTSRVFPQEHKQICTYGRSQIHVALHTWTEARTHAHTHTHVLTQIDYISDLCKWKVACNYYTGWLDCLTDRRRPFDPIYGWRFCFCPTLFFSFFLFEKYDKCTHPTGRHKQ